MRAATLLLEMRAVVPSPETIRFINTLGYLAKGFEVRWLTDLSHEELQEKANELGIDISYHSFLERPQVVRSAKLSKSSADYWWKLDAFKQEAVSNPFHRLLWIDPETDANSDAIDNWLDPLGVLEDDRLYLNELSSQTLPEAKRFFGLD